MGKTSVSLKKWFKAFLIALFVVLAIRAFFIQSYRVTGDNNYGLLYDGDYVMVNKLAYGARLPITPIGFPGLNAYSSVIEIPYLRLPGFSKPERNDIIAFNYPNQSDVPIDRKDVMFSVCAGLPSDTVRINGKKVYSGKTQIVPESCVRFRYRVIVLNEASYVVDTLKKISPNFIQIAESVIYDVSLNEEEVELINSFPEVDTVRIIRKWERERDTEIFPGTSTIAWNADVWGPVIVPSAGSKVVLTLSNVDLYRRIIEVFEGNRLEIIDKQILVNGAPVDEYTFKQDYYLVIDNNRDFGKDSRRWGFLPESHIIGKASVVVYSRTRKDGPKSDRKFFERIR